MVQEPRNVLSLYDEAKAGLFSLVQQTLVVFLGLGFMLLVTGGAPSTFIVTFSVCLGTAFVSWSEQKRLRNLISVHSAIAPHKAEPESAVTEEQPYSTSNTSDSHRKNEILKSSSIKANKIGIINANYSMNYRTQIGIQGNANANRLMNYGTQIGIRGNNAQFDKNRVEQLSFLAEVAEEIQQLLEQLEQTNPDAKVAEQISFVSAAIAPSTKRRIVEASKIVSPSEVRQFWDNSLDNSSNNIGMAIVESWMRLE
ncbi:MAG: hypothetical protein F6K30_27395 [Cyanothece sp. SIO2G6]|nr:hypothetical protein [Cyanothece sp. SIO2G6]